MISNDWQNWESLEEEPPSSCDPLPRPHECLENCQANNPHHVICSHAGAQPGRLWEPGPHAWEGGLVHPGTAL